jgi:hypothetical protein
MAEADHADDALLKRWESWAPQHGYSAEPLPTPEAKTGSGHTLEDLLAQETLPRRSVAPGLHMGLSVVLNVEKDEYYCSGTESVGILVSLSKC